MPGINLKALDTMQNLALDVLELKLNEEVTFNFKDEPITIKRIG